MTDIINSLWEPIDVANVHPSPNGVAKEDAPNTVPEVIRAIKGGVKRAYQQSNALFVSTGSGNAYVLTYPQAPEGYAKGIFYKFFVNHTNTGAASLNINGLGVKAILQQDGAALKAGQMVNGSTISVVYDGTAFRLQNYISNPKFSGTLDADAISAATITGTHSGNGAALTALNASNIATGTIADARLPATMSGKSFTGDVTINQTLSVGSGSSGGTLEIGKIDGTAGNAVIDLHTSATAVDYNVRLIASGNTAIGVGTLDIISGTLNHNGQEVWDKGMLPTPAVQATQVIAGNGLTGGGTIAANRTLTLGTPGTITNTTTNAVTTTSHTHALTLVAADITGALGYVPSKGDGLPIGSMIMIYGNDSSAPPGFLLANGATVTATYPELRAFGLARGWSVTSGNPRLPDMGGYFPRGWRSGQTVDSGRVFGSVQQDALQNITGSLNSMGSNSAPMRADSDASGALAIVDTGLATGNGVSLGNGVGNRRVLGFDASLVARTADETRPSNVTVTYWVKAYDVDNTSGSINLSNVTNDVNAVSARVTALEAPTVRTSGQIQLVANSTVPWAHGLGAIPGLVTMSMVCTTPDGGYSVGDTVEYIPQILNGNGNFGTIIRKDATNVYLQTAGNMIPWIYVKNSSTAFTPTMANWKIIVRAQK
jgi:hypothetical protein